MVQGAQFLELEMLSKHHRPRDEAENHQANCDDLAHGLAAQEHIDDIGRRQDG